MMGLSKNALCGVSTPQESPHLRAVNAGFSGSKSLPDLFCNSPMMRGLVVLAVVMVFGCGFSAAADVNVGIPNATPAKLATQKKPLQLKTLLAGFDKGSSENSVAQLPTDSPVVASGDAVTEVLVTGNFSLSPAFLLDQAAVKPGDALNPFLINRAK